MARRRRRNYRGLDVVPGLSGLKTTLTRGWGPNVLMGIAAFLGAHFAVKWISNRYLAGRIPEIAVRFSPLIAGVAAAVAMPFIGKRVLKLSPEKIKGITVGALGAGLTVVAVQEAKQMFPMLADYSDLRLSGMILQDPQLAGMLLTDASTALPYGAAPSYVETDFAALAAAGDSDDEEGAY